MGPTRPAFTSLCRLALAPVFIGVACQASPAAAQPTFRCELLRAPQGLSAGGIPMAINRGADVVGVHEGLPLEWNKKGKGRELGREAFASGYSMGGVNDDGHAVGHAAFIMNQHPQQDVAFIWAPDGTFQRLARFEDQRTVATSINNAGVIAGWAQLSGGPIEAMLWEDGQQQPLPALKHGLDAEAHQINDKGVVVGQSGLTVDGATATHAVKWVRHRVHDLGALPGHSTSGALALNAHGVIVGYSMFQPVAWVNGAIQSLTKSGQFVGETSTLGATYWPQVGAEAVALDSTIEADHPCRSAEGDPVSLTSARAINVHGVIVGYGTATSPSGTAYAAGFKLVPVIAR
jgi:uncharacterized membrane protein